VRAVGGAALAPVLVLLLLLGGCGTDKPTDKDQIETTIITYYKAFASGDTGGACNELAKAVKEQLEKAGGGKDCTEVLDAALKRPDYAKLAPKLKDVEVSAVTIAVGKATAKTTVPGVGSTPVALVKEGGAWKIASPVGQ
jgi:hypothetical protein